MHLINPANGQDAKYKPRFSAIFDSANAFELLKQCSRCTPANVMGYWTPTRVDVDGMEGNFKDAYELAPDSCSFYMGKLSDSLNGFVLQYGGVIIHGKKFIYVNAFPWPLFKEIINPQTSKNLDPQTVPLIFCDGGASLWGILYNIETRKFSDLSFNAEG